MNLLGVDTSSLNVSLSLMRQGRIIVDSNRRIKFGASSLLPRIDRYLKKHSLTLNDFDAFVVGRGPGSFTGLRISCSLIKAFSLALSKPVIALGSFYSMAYPFMGKQAQVIVITDARRGLVYCASFVKGRLQTREKLTTLPEALKDKPDSLFITYDARLRQGCSRFYKKDTWPRASYLLELARTCYNKSEFTRLDRLQPLYLHPKHCQVRR